MGCSYYAHTVIGIKVDPEKLYTEQRVKAFEHDHPEDWEVDPKTGKKLWVVEHVPIDGAEDDKVAGYDLVEGQYGSGSVFIALRHQRADYYHPEDFLSLKTDGFDFSSKEVSDMADALTALGLWDPKSFGIHTFLVVSC